MKIFVTGIAGLLGSHLAERLIKDGHEVSGCDNLIGGYRENVPEGATFYEMDCNERVKLVEILQGVDVVYHAACTAYEGLSVFSPHFITENTSGITMSVFSASIQARVKRFVYLSSMARYGTQEWPFTEDMLPKPQDPYGVAKYASEMSIKELSSTHGIQYVVVVPHNIIGVRQKYDDPFRNVASIFINKMLQGQSPVIYGDGQQMRCFSFVDDVVEPLVKVGIEDGMHGQVINVGPDKGEITIKQLYETVARLTGFEGQPIYLPDRPREVKIAYCSADKARKLLGYEAKTSLEKGLQEMVEWIKAKGTKPFNYHLPIEIDNDLLPKSWKEKLI